MASVCRFRFNPQDIIPRRARELDKKRAPLNYTEPDYHIHYYHIHYYHLPSDLPVKLSAHPGAVSYHYLKSAVSPPSKPTLFWDSLTEAASTMFGSNDIWIAPGYRGIRFENFLFWFSWCCIILAVIYMVKPWIEHQLYTNKELEHARVLVQKYGQNPASYLTLENDKLLYFGRKVDGVIPYGTVGNTIIVNGDPICSDDDFSDLLKEFRQFCRQSAHNIFFLSITDHFLAEYKKQGLGIVKSGEEARFELADYSIDGKKGAKMRMNINHASKAGITVHEYKILQKKDLTLEQEFDRVTGEWLSKKKSGLLTFTMGGSRP